MNYYCIICLVHKQSDCLTFVHPLGIRKTKIIYVKHVLQSLIYRFFRGVSIGHTLKIDVAPFDLFLNYNY